MDFFYIALYPFTLLLNFFYSFFENYGIALILFAVVVKLILFPLSLKGKKSMIKMNLLSGRQQQLQKQYGKDQARLNEEVQKLYAQEKVNPMGGCLWSMLPMFVLLPLYSIIRQPLKYLMGLSGDQIQQVATAVNWNNAAMSNGWIKQIAEEFTSSGYNQLYLASLINEGSLPAVESALGAGTKVFAMNFDFFGLDLAMMPTWKIWENPTWPVIGGFLMILVSVATSVLFSRVSMKTNKMNTQSNGDGNEQAEKTNKMMMWMSPVMSLWIGFIMPLAMCLYWIANNVLSLVQEIVAGKMLKKDYEAARVATEERERQEKEDEKLRKEEARLERARRIEDEKQNRGKKKPAQKKNDEPAQEGVNKDDSRDGLRAYARGRAYVPNRFDVVTEYKDPNVLMEAQAQAQAEAAANKGKKKTKGSAPAEVEEKTEVEELIAPVTPAIETEEIEIEVEEIEIDIDEDDQDKEGI